MTISEIEKAIESTEIALSANPDGRTKELLLIGLQAFNDMLLAEQQKKSQSQPIEKVEQLPTKTEMQTWARQIKTEGLDESKRKEKQPNLLEQKTSYAHVETSEEQPTYTITTTANANIKTVKAPDFVTPDDLINVILEDAKGNEYTRTGTKAQVRSLTRKYFSNVHESWMGKEKKMKTGFKNLLSYVVAWKEFDGALPTLRDVLPDYDRYKKAKDGEEASEAFKVAQELYDKIVEILTK